MGWIFKSIIATILVVPAWLAIGFFERNFGIKPAVMLLWYSLGMFLGGVALLKWFPFFQIATIWPNNSIVAIIILGITIGALANTLLFMAITQAPNPGLPIAVVNSASLFVFLISGMVATLLPSYFSKVRLDIYHLIGIFLIIAGLFFILLRR